jgi:hypothetical protein
MAIFCGCKNNSVEPSTSGSSSTSMVFNGAEYVMTTPKTTYSFHDTLSGAITATNISNKIDTIGIGNTEGMWSYALKDDSGKVVIDGPHAFSNILGRIIIKPGESSIVNWVVFGTVNNFISDSTTFKHYTFQMGLYNNSILLSEGIIIQ